MAESILVDEEVILKEGRSHPLTWGAEEGAVD